MSDGVALLDRDGAVLHMNHRLAQILGAPRPAEPGTPFTTFMRAPELDELLRHARGATSPAEADLRLWSPQPRLVHATASPLRTSEGGVLLVLHDLTEIETLNRVRQDFVANVSHELRTPLTSIRGYAETLLDGGLEDAANREGFVGIIRDQTLRLEALVSDLLSLAELENPEARLHRERFDLRDSAERVAGASRPAAERAGLALEVEPGDPVPLDADRTRLEQVLANLIDNAVKYTERGSVRVRVGHDDGAAWCEVTDTGPGIPLEDQGRIFERFYRVDKARAREKGGTGLGLSIVKHILALHGGHISVRSTPGTGSTFRFVVPAGDSGAGA
jgi:two-component system phosphate regulon sensor histidine kinase PhoR